MRIFILLLLALGTALLFALYPEIISQTLRIEAFGWVFETRQGAFITLLVILLALFWLLQRILAAILAGPGQLWRTLRLGSRKRRTQRLHEGVGELIDMRGDLGRRAFAKSRGTVPDWAPPLLKTLTLPANEQQLAEKEDNPLLIALAARIATDPDAPNRPDSAERKAHLQAWLNVHPGAPLALARMAKLAEEEQEWQTVVTLLEELWKQGQRSAASIKPRLANAYIRLADSDSDNRQNYLRKAHRLESDSTPVIMALGRANIADGNRPAAEKLWLEHLARHNDFEVAAALLEAMKSDSLQSFRKLDKKDAATDYNHAMRWLQASLAQAAGLSGLAAEIIEELAVSDAEPEILRACAEWYAAAGQWQQASRFYALLNAPQPDDN